MYRIQSYELAVLLFSSSVRMIVRPWLHQEKKGTYLAGLANRKPFFEAPCYCWVFTVLGTSFPGCKYLEPLRGLTDIVEAMVAGRCDFKVSCEFINAL